MNRFFQFRLMLAFWASPYSSIYDLILATSDMSASRRAAALAPGFPREDTVDDPPIRPIRPIPTDVPVPDPQDVPVREPMDVPPPDPNVVPKPAKEWPQREDPKPRPTP